jgi:diguanylate cyclase (GGDEF)-like protein/PAS domain S-box-containing protein
LLSFLRRIPYRGLICIALGLIGFAAVAIGATIVALRDDTLRDAVSDTANIATVLAEQTTRSLQALDIVASNVAERFGEVTYVSDEEFGALLRSPNTYQFLNERLAHLTHTDFIALLDKDGQIANTTRSPVTPVADMSDRDYFKYTRNNPGRSLYISDIVANRVSGENNIFFARRISGPGGEFRGLVLTGIRLAYFQHIYNSITSLRNQSFMLLRRDGTILVRHPDPEARTGSKMPPESAWYNIVAWGGGFYRSPGHFDGAARLVSVRPLKDYELVVNVAVSEKAALATWTYRAMLIALGGVMALLCLLLLIHALNQKFAQLATSKTSLGEREARLAEKTRELEEANLRLDMALNNMALGLVMFNDAGELVVCNGHYLDIYRLTPEGARPGTDLTEILRQRSEAGTFFEDIASYVETVTEAMQAGAAVQRVIELPDGRVLSVTNHPTGGGGWVSTHEDITERRRDEKELARARHMLRAVVENIPEMLIVKDAVTRRYVHINRAGESFLGIQRENLIGRTSAEIFPGEQAGIIEERDNMALRSGQLLVQSSSVHTVDGRIRDIVSKRVAIGSQSEEPDYLLTVVEDVTERKRNETRIAHLAHHDHLTDLPNRAALHLKLAAMLEQAAQSDAPFAVLCIDLDRFKEVNDLYGHAAGDNVLLELSKRMEAIAGGAFLARLGGDEFMALCPDADMAAANALAERLVAAIADDIDCDGRKVTIGMSIGIAISPSDGTDSATLLRNADAALYRAKAEGRGAIRFFEAEMDRMLHDRRALQADLALAVSRNELQLHYQPQTRIGGQTVGFEALIRWDHLRRGFVPPDTFIPLAEQSGLIDQIGEWVLREACREAASWRKPLQIAINLSPVQLRQGEIVNLVHSVLLETGLSPQRLVIEITEGALMDDYSRAVSILRRLKALGVRIAMDDFGTGYSSLSYLQSFPFDKIKIDKTFISNLDRNAQSAAIVRAVLGLGRNLNLTTVAEGVENPDQIAILRREGCDELQGFLIGRPQPIADYADLIGRTAGEPMRRRSAG